MQIMQVTYAMGSVVESIFPAFVLCVTPQASRHAAVTSFTQACLHIHAYCPFHSCLYDITLGAARISVSACCLWRVW